MILGMLWPLHACSDVPKEYAAEAIEARVVDAETRKPLKGVIVVIHWELKGGFEGNSPVGQMEVNETVTDKTGHFYFPAWGPRPRPKGYLRSSEPHILLFKPGYEYKRLANEVSSKVSMEPLRRSDWNGKTIELKPFKGTTEQYARHFESLNNDLEHIAADQPEECNWKNLPKIIMAMANEREVLERKGINPHTLSSIDKRLSMNDEYYAKKGGPVCGSPKEFLRNYQP
jgi:hypothetical protein